MEDKENLCKCGMFKRESEEEKALKKENAILQQRIDLLEEAMKEK